MLGYVVLFMTQTDESGMSTNPDVDLRGSAGGLFARPTWLK
jgi:hypothetical protein